MVRKRGSVTKTRGRGRGRVAPPQEDPEDSPLESEAESVAGSVAGAVAGATTEPAEPIEVEVEEVPQSSEDTDALPSIQAAKCAKKRRRELVTSDFTLEQEQDMVDWLQAPNQECLLNKKHRNYMKKGLKDALWEEKATEMEKSSEILKKWYSNMRTRYGKLRQAPSGSGSLELTERDQWILRHFEFLRPHLIVQVKKRIPVSVSKFHNFMFYLSFPGDLRAVLSDIA